MLRVTDLVKRYSATAGAGIQGIDFDVRQGEFFTLLGPSGCGKTTTLRSVAGLERPDSGEIEINGKLVYSGQRGIAAPAAARDISMVFQSYAIWPHMSVFENVAFPLRTQKIGGAELRRRVQHALEMVGLETLGDRPAPLLSGGQQQRVALARAIVKEAPLILLDEPLSNLDAKLREQMRRELRELQQRIGTTAVYVTHDQEEALSLSDRIAVMRSGKVVELGTPSQLYYSPRTRFAARFLGQTELMDCRLVERSGNSVLLQTPLGVLQSTNFPDTLAPAIKLMARPEHFELVETASEGSPNVLAGAVASVVFSGKFVDYSIRIGDQLLRVQSMSLRSAAVGERICVRIPADRCVVVNDDGDE